MSWNAADCCDVMPRGGCRSFGLVWWSSSGLNNTDEWVGWCHTWGWHICRCKMLCHVRVSYTMYQHATVASWMHPRRSGLQSDSAGRTEEDRETLQGCTFALIASGNGWLLIGR